jgi:UDP-N-acetylmuramate--alanine ligase
MINIEDISSVYLIGIGGIGMSALAQYFYEIGCKVAGSDRMHSYVTAMLEDKGILVHYDEDPKHLDFNPDLVIYTPAISEKNLEFQYACSNFEFVCKRSEVLQKIVEDKYCVAVSGTHGKTSITSMIAHILSYTDDKVNAFVGGVCKNINNNFYYNKGSRIVVVEADEYDRSFLKLTPNIAVVNAVEEDHLDIYGNLENIIKTYNQFVEKTKPINRLINVKYKKYFDEGCTYGINQTADFKILKYFYSKGLLTVKVWNGKNIVKYSKLRVFGKFNVENFCAALNVACRFNVSDQIIEKAMREYKGVKRRFDVRYESKNLILIDDYAHHPVEIQNIHSAIRDVYRGKTIIAIFQPHLYTRTRDFMNDFAQCLSTFDKLYLLDIYPAREAPIEGVSSQAICDIVNKINPKIDAKVVKKQDINSLIENIDTDIVATIGAGDIDKVCDKIVSILNNKDN